MHKKNYFFLSGFALRIIAILAVLSDHIALLFVAQQTLLYTGMRIFGRIAFVLFAFFISEGVFFSKNRDKYLLRLFWLYLALQVMSVGVYLYDATFVFKNVFATLLAGAAFLTYFAKKEWKKVYYLIPFLVTVVINILSDRTGNKIISLFSGDYGNYGLMMIIAFYFARMASMKLYLTYYPPSVVEENTRTVPQKIINTSAVLAILFVSILYYVLDLYNQTYFDVAIQSFALLVIPLFLLYNGKLGYTSRSWRTFYYLFFPVHIILLTIIAFILIGGSL